MNIIKVEDVTTKISRTRLMNAIARDSSFAYNSVDVDIVEHEKYKKYEYTVYFNKNDRTKCTVGQYEPTNDIDAREWHNMYKHPQNNYAAIVVIGEPENADTQFLLHYHKGSAEEAAIHLTDLIIQKFLDHKGITSITELHEYVNQYESKEKMRNAFQSKLNSYKKQLESRTQK